MSVKLAVDNTIKQSFVYKATPSHIERLAAIAAGKSTRIVRKCARGTNKRIQVIL